MAKQAKALGAKLRIQQGEQDEEEEEGGEGGAGDMSKLWGARKGAYYGADLADLEVGGVWGDLEWVVRESPVPPSLPQQHQQPRALIHFYSFSFHS